MSSRLTRRSILAGLASGAAVPAFGLAPETAPRPLARGARPTAPAPAPFADLIAAAGLGGGVAFAVANRATGEVIESFNPGFRMPPASVAKAATAYYALDRLGGDFRFETAIYATAPIVSGRIDGDLVLRGGGDPTLDTDALGDLVATLKDAGLVEITGRFRIDARALPALPHIDPDQPDHVGYNPSIDGVNLNYNRVHFEWKKARDDYEITMQARALRFRPGVSVARMEIADRSAPVYTFQQARDFDQWTVARGALGKEGARWLPVRRPADYAADVFLTLARSYGIDLRRGEDWSGPVPPVLLAVHRSDALGSVMQSMLNYSTNLTAEAAGLTATLAGGVAPGSLIRSAREMNLWLRNGPGARATGFVDHSGLGYGSRVTPVDMVTVLQAAAKNDVLRPILKDFRTESPQSVVKAKTGTLNFTSGLAGYIDPPGGTPLTFAIFCADGERRDAIAVEQRERPPGARGWARRARTLQKKLIDRWVGLTA